MSQDYMKQIKIFFDYKQEKILNQKISKENLEMKKEDVFSYVHSIVDIPLEDFVQYIIEHCKRKPILAADVFQFSDFEDATTKICDVIKSTNFGLGFVDIGKLLLNDGNERNDTALSKYGENHIKTAELLGLAFKSEKKYYLSCIGVIFNDLPNKTKEQLLVRLILRNKLVSQILIAANQGEFDLETFLYDLSHSTYVRRRSNIKCVLNKLISSKEYDFSDLVKQVVF